MLPDNGEIITKIYEYHTKGNTDYLPVFLLITKRITFFNANHITLCIAQAAQGFPVS